MIKSNEIIGIVYSENSYVYAKSLEKIIKKYNNMGYPIKSLIVDSDLIDKYDSVFEHVFENLKQCDYTFVFCTKDYKLDSESNKYISKPNIILELGYFLHLLESSKVKCLIDFSYNEIKSEKYLIPSDIAGKMFISFDGNNTEEEFNKIIHNFLIAFNINSINKFDIDQITKSLILNKHYLTDFSQMFSQKQKQYLNKS